VRNRGPGPTRPPDHPVPARGRVFVDDTGRRRRRVHGAGIAIGVACIGYVAGVVFCMTQTSAGVLPAVPAAGNRVVAGLPLPVEPPGILERTAVPEPSTSPARGG
jgi:hypothetical protein